MLLADAVLVRLPVSTRAGADPGLEAAAAQNLSTGRRRGSRKNLEGLGAAQENERGAKASLTLWFPG